MQAEISERDCENCLTPSSWDSAEPDAPSGLPGQCSQLSHVCQALLGYPFYLPWACSEPSVPLGTPTQSLT